MPHFINRARRLTASEIAELCAVSTSSLISFLFKRGSVHEYTVNLERNLGQHFNSYTESNEHSILVKVIQNKFYEYN